jgi:anti-sigma regulatory factor (Ser/Thr protein kinase)
VSGTQTQQALRDPSDVGEARRAAVALAKRMGFAETDSGKVALVATELSSNVLKHATRGELLLAERESGGQPCIEIVALDRGPGMADVTRCLEDGYSTAGSAGTGLGAIRRLSTDFEVYSAPGLGSALLSRIVAGQRASSCPGRAHVGVLGLPLAGETVSGDQWAVVEQDDRVLVIVADGLGHGRLAFEAAAAAVRVFHAHPAEQPAQILQHVHAALRGMRGAAASIAEVRFTEGKVSYAGIGNVAGFVTSAQGSRGMLGQNGTLGAEARRFQTFDYDWPPGGQLVMYSDGLSGNFNLKKYPGLAACDPSLIAAVLYRDHSRGRDDVTVVVLREVSA